MPASVLWQWGCVPTFSTSPQPLTPVQDTVGCRRNISRYSTLDIGFPSTRECKFLNALAETFENGDQEEFTAAVVEYDQIMKLDNWKTSILLKIKRGISEEPSML